MNATYGQFFRHVRCESNIGQEVIHPMVPLPSPPKVITASVAEFWVQWCLVMHPQKNYIELEGERAVLEDWQNINISLHHFTLHRPFV